MNTHADYVSIRDQLIEWLDDNYHFGDAEELITSDDLSFMDNGILDSLGFVQLVLFLENTYSFQLDRKDLSRENFDGMRKIIDYVTGHPQYQGAA